MKKILLITIIIFTLFKTYGQIEKSKWIASVSLSANTRNGENSMSSLSLTSKYRFLDLGASIGNMISNKFLLGVGLSYRAEFNEAVYVPNENYSKRTSNGIGASCYLKYFNQLGKNLYTIPSISFNYYNDNNISKSKNTGFQETVSKDEGYDIKISLSPVQFSYILKNKYLFQAGFGVIEYGYGKGKITAPTNSSTNSSGGFNINFSPGFSNVGVSIIF